ncbi:protein SIEVE ELEMENT OCCLUSION C [Ricinus communis]|uniref:protein SIEVE ELEMENT OCCLUSION C n=1 Tax=Ricinus communis TaxID=3988 RepID=UPI000D686ACE|nr:protein SIEVE ELEMENT OCCLUSION C [Ricinus communis]|eukprot:XP_025012374.1 protein SIEVE ELEMENT OCCLUSION C [Ricinus communis]
MNFFRNDPFSLHSSSSPSEEDILIKKITLTHDPDGRHLDSEQLLRAMQNVMCYTAASEVSSFQIDGIADNDVSNIEVVGAQESLSQIISKLSCEMLCKSSREVDMHARTMILFDLLGNYRWDAKVVLVLAAFATSYGRLWLIMQLYPHNPLAVSVAMLKQLPNDLSMFKPRFKALSLLVKTMVDVTKCIIKFEGLPFRHVKLDDEAMAITKSYIYISSYWVKRSTLACSFQITDLDMKPEQVNSSSTTIAAWQLSTLVYRLSSICSRLSRQVDLCHRKIETKLYQKLLNLFQEAHSDNQEVLGLLLALKDDFSLTKSTMQEKIGMSELKDKVVILLVSSPELLPLEEVFLLIHQTYDQPQHKKLEDSYEIVWVPISISGTWTDAEAERFNILCNSLPWYSIWRPWLLHSAVVNYIKQEWNFKDDPLMVVLDPRGMVTNSNAIDMVSIWGAKAFPFSSSREEQLWEEESWSLQFLVDDIDPLLTRWVEEDRNICIYGSDNLDWIREFNAKFETIRSSDVQLEMVYVGNKNLTELVRHTLAIIEKETHSSSLSFTKLQFFWLRLESMRRSKLRMGESISSEHIQKGVAALLDSTDEGWAVIGRGNTTDIVKVEGREMIECLNKFSEWGDNVAKLGFLGALRTALEPPSTLEPCNHIKILPYAEGLVEKIVACDKCKRPVKKYILYE